MYKIFLKGNQVGFVETAGANLVNHRLEAGRVGARAAGPVRFVAPAGK